MCVFDDFPDIRGGDQQLALMPISRLALDEPLEVQGSIIYPAGAIDLGELRVVSRDLGQINPTPGQAVFFGAQTLRDQIIALTGCDLDVFLQNPVIVFRILIDWDAFLVADHREDIKLLKRLNQEAEQFIDIIKFHECRFDLPDTIPGRAGSWDGSGQHLGALLYNPGDHESYIIAGTAAPPTAVVSGLGLYLESGLQEGNEGLATSGEVGMLAKHALALFRDVLEASSETHRFVRAMTLLEFLASPNTMTKMQEVKKEIACHVAHDCASYQVVLERFKDLSSSFAQKRAHRERPRG